MCWWYPLFPGQRDLAHPYRRFARFAETMGALVFWVRDYLGNQICFKHLVFLVVFVGCVCVVYDVLYRGDWTSDSPHHERPCAVPGTGPRARLPLHNPGKYCIIIIIIWVIIIWITTLENTVSSSSSSSSHHNHHRRRRRHWRHLVFLTPSS